MFLITIRREFSSLKNIYLETVKNKQMHVDPKQLEVITQFEKLQDDIERTHPAWKRSRLAEDLAIPQSTVAQKEETKTAKGSFFSNLFKRQFSTMGLDYRIPGIYLYGGSGCGKSFLSDIFFNNLSIKEKQRQHFHQFMGGIHAELFELERKNQGYDPLIKVADNRARLQRLLYLDEFQVTDVADASILKRLFEQLLGKGMILLATSNRHPTDLYKNGHQREFFLPFIEILETKNKILHLTSHDYRLTLEKYHDSKDTTYIYPNSDVNAQRFDRVFDLVTGVTQPLEFVPVTLEPVKGRHLVVHRALKQVCYYDFEQLLDAIMGDADFRAISKNFKAIFIKNFRPLKPHERNIANRLIKLFDEAYFRHLKIYLLASEPLEKIFLIPENPKNQEQFAIIRCHSRLIEFQTRAYHEVPSYCQLPENNETLVQEDSAVPPTQKEQ